MINKVHLLSVVFGIGLFIAQNHCPASAQNPIIRNQFTADPTARVFNGKVYLFPSHDIKAPEGKNLRKDWFCMADYHVFSSENLTNWTDHGVIVSQNSVQWVDSNSYSMWAPDCVEHNGKYYFYFPANRNRTGGIGRGGFGIGVAIAEKPEGPYVPQAEPIKGAMGIDPNVFIDKDGQPYIIWSMGRFSIAKLKDNMVELASEPVEVKDLPAKGMKEGPFLFQRNGIYYMTYPHVENTIERLEYAIADNPLGPYKFAGVIMDESPMNCWTNHHSVIEYKGQWYLFYHQNALSPKFDKNRSVCIDSLSFNPDGTIRKVVPTLRGIGISDASDKIEIDRYSAKSEKGSAVELIDTLNTFQGWKTILNNEGWVQYNAIGFSDKKIKSLQIRTISENGAKIQLYLDGMNEAPLAEVNVPAGKQWNSIETKISKIKPGTHNLIVKVKEGKAEIDWCQFK